MSLANDPSVNTIAVAATTQTQAGALAGTGNGGTPCVLQGNFNSVTSVGSAGDATILPTGCGKGAQVIARNSAGVNSMGVFPPVGGTIDGAAVNAVQALAAGKSKLYWCSTADGLTWFTLLGA